MDVAGVIAAVIAVAVAAVWWLRFRVDGSVDDKATDKHGGQLVASVLKSHGCVPAQPPRAESAAPMCCRCVPGRSAAARGGAEIWRADGMRTWSLSVNT